MCSVCRCSSSCSCCCIVPLLFLLMCVVRRLQHTVIDAPHPLCCAHGTEAQERFRAAIVSTPSHAMLEAMLALSMAEGHGGGAVKVRAASVKSPHGPLPCGLCCELALWSCALAPGAGERPPGLIVAPPIDTGWQWEGRATRLPPRRRAQTREGRGKAGATWSVVPHRQRHPVATEGRRVQRVTLRPHAAGRGVH